MKVSLKKTILRKTILGYRKLRHQRGYGVHSPFVYTLITKVIEERHPYYAYQDIEQFRKQFWLRADPVVYPDRRRKGREHTQPLGTLIRREAISPRKGTLLFRLANYYKTARILQIGSSHDLSAVYLSAYAKGVWCTVLEPVPAFAAVAREMYAKSLFNPIDLREGAYEETLPGVLTDLKLVDFIFFNTCHEQNNPIRLFRECVNYTNEQAVFVFNEIKANRAMRQCWHEVCTSPDVTVTVDLYSIGIAFRNPKLHKRTYKAYLK